MKKLLLGLTLLASMSSFADMRCDHLEVKYLDMESNPVVEDRSSGEITVFKNQKSIEVQMRSHAVVQYENDNRWHENTVNSTYIVDFKARKPKINSDQFDYLEIDKYHDGGNCFLCFTRASLKGYEVLSVKTDDDTVKVTRTFVESRNKKLSKKEVEKRLKTSTASSVFTYKNCEKI